MAQRDTAPSNLTCFQPSSLACKLSLNRSRSLEMPHTQVTKTEFISFSRGPQGGGYILAVKLIYLRSRTVDRLGPTVLVEGLRSESTGPAGRD